MQLVGQTIEELTRAGITDASIIRPGSHEAKRGSVSVLTYASLVKHCKNAANGDRFMLNPSLYELVILDEAHHAMAEGSSSALRLFPHAFQIGFTATPDYSDTRQLRSLFPQKIHIMSIKEAIAFKAITSYANVVLNLGADLSNVSLSKNGDYDARELEKALNTEDRNTVLANYLSKTLEDAKTIVSCAGIRHAEDLTAQMRQNGMKAAAIHGRLSRDAQTELIESFRRGEIKVLVNSKILAEGFDDPSVEVVVNASSTLSKVRELQRSGRALRINPDDPNKQALIIDCIDRNNRNAPVIFSDESMGGGAGLETVTPKIQGIIERMRGLVPGGVELHATEEAIKTAVGENTIKINGREYASQNGVAQVSQHSLNGDLELSYEEVMGILSKPRLEDVELSRVQRGLSSGAHWTEYSLCKETDPEAFFPEKGGETKSAKKVCSRCIARVACLDYALEAKERFGVWGGLSERERRKMLVSKAV